MLSRLKSTCGNRADLAAARRLSYFPQSFFMASPIAVPIR